MQNANNGINRLDAIDDPPINTVGYTSGEHHYLWMFTDDNLQAAIQSAWKSGGNPGLNITQKQAMEVISAMTELAKCE
jgi:hypothetical protein